MKIDRNWFLIAIMIVLASILLPFMQEGSFAGNVVESEVVYRDGWFGPYIERVTLDNGGVTYVDVYPWYYFKDFKPSTMDFTNIVATGHGGASWVTSDTLYVTTNDASTGFLTTFTEKNNVYLTGRLGGIGDGPQEVTHSRVSLHKGRLTDFTHVGMIAWSDETGPWLYGVDWTTDLNIHAAHFNDAYGEHDFTVRETQWAKPSGNLFETAYDTDIAWIVVSLYRPETPEVIEGGVGTITLNILDNNVQTSANVDVYKNGQLLKSVYIPNGEYVFKDLEFGNYRFVVTDSTYSVKFYDAMPQQLYFDYDVGVIELSSRINTVSYYINGDFEGSTADPYENVGDGTGGIPWYNTTPDDITNKTESLLENLAKLVPGGGDDGSSFSLTQILGMIAALLTSMGLLTSVAVIGLPIFIVGILFLFIVAFVKSGDKTNYSPGNKKGGRKR